MTDLRGSQRATKRQSEANFTGEVFSDEIVTGKTPSRIRASVVSFTPGRRTAYQSHPVGQTLYCLSGAGRVLCEGQPVHELRPGDTVI
jgi:quercetin dioxygenase-like cupin family protein